MSGTQPTMADAQAPPGLPPYCMPLPVDPPRPGIECGIGDSEPSSEEESEDDKPLKISKALPKSSTSKTKTKGKGEPKRKGKGEPKRKSKAMSVSFYGDDIDENSSVVEVGKWVQGIRRLGLSAVRVECSEMFEEHNINGSGLLKMVKIGHMVKLGLKVDECEIILKGIDILRAKSKAKRSLDKAIDEVVVGDISDEY